MPHVFGSVQFRADARARQGQSIWACRRRWASSRKNLSHVGTEATHRLHLADGFIRRVPRPHRLAAQDRQFVLAALGRILGLPAANDFVWRIADLVLARISIASAGATASWEPQPNCCFRRLDLAATIFWVSCPHARLSPQ